MSKETRPSPSISAQVARDKIKEGNDGNMYLSKPDRNGVYHWKRLWQMSEVKTAAEYYDQFPHKPRNYDTKEVVTKLRAVAKALNKHNIPLIPIGWRNVWDFGDNAADDAYEIADSKFISGGPGPGYFSKPLMFYTDHNLYFASITGKLYIKYDLDTCEKVVSKNELVKLSKERRALVVEAFKKYFGNRFAWNGSKAAAMMVKLVKK